MAYDLKIEFYAEDIAEARIIAEKSLKQGEYIGEIKENGAKTYLVPKEES